MAAKLRKNTQTHKHTSFRNGLAWFEDGGIPITYTHPRDVHSERSSRPGQGDNTRSVKISRLLQTTGLVYIQDDEDEVRGSEERQSQIIFRMCFLLHMCVK